MPRPYTRSSPYPPFLRKEDREKWDAEQAAKQQAQEEAKLLESPADYSLEELEDAGFTPLPEVAFSASVMSSEASFPESRVELPLEEETVAEMPEEAILDVLEKREVFSPIKFHPKAFAGSCPQCFQQLYSEAGVVECGCGFRQFTVGHL